MTSWLDMMGMGSGVWDADDVECLLDRGHWPSRSARPLAVRAAEEIGLSVCRTRGVAGSPHSGQRTAVVRKIPESTSLYALSVSG